MWQEGTVSVVQLGRGRGVDRQAQQGEIRQTNSIPNSSLYKTRP